MLTVTIKELVTNSLLFPWKTRNINWLQIMATNYSYKKCSFCIINYFETVDTVIDTPKWVRSSFGRICGITFCVKILGNVTQTLFVAAIIGNDWQPSWILILLLRNKIFKTNFLRFFTPQQHIFKGKYYKSITIRSRVMEIPILVLLTIFCGPTFSLSRIVGIKTTTSTTMILLVHVNCGDMDHVKKM